MIDHNCSLMSAEGLLLQLNQHHKFETGTDRVLLSALPLAGQTRPFFFLKRRDLGLAVLGKKIIQRLGEQILNGRVMLGREKT